MMKKLMALTATAFLSISTAFGSLAGSWQQFGTAWKWAEDNGTYAVSTWKWLDGNHDGIAECYYFDGNANMVSNTTTPDGYTLDQNGCWTVNGIPQKKYVGGAATPQLVTKKTTVMLKDVYDGDDFFDDEEESDDWNDEDEADEWDDEYESDDWDDDDDFYANLPTSRHYTGNLKSSADYEQNDVAFAEEVIRLVNVERRKAGLSSLREDPDLMEIAEIRTNELLEKFSHTRPNGSDCFTLYDNYGLENEALGENIARGQTTPEQVVDCWMHSSGHRANILSPKFHRIGVGAMPCTGFGGYAWTQTFSA